MKYLATLAAVVAISLLAHFTYDAFRVRGRIYENLNDHWIVHVDNKEFKNMAMPIVLDRFTGDKRGAKASLTRTFTVPSECRRYPCYLFFGQVGDLSKVYIDGNLIKSQGYADGYKSLARYHPLFVELPETHDAKLTVRLDIESLYGVEFGISKSHVFVGDYAAVTTTGREMAMDSVISPLMQALVLSILGLLALICWKLAKFDRPIFIFGVFALLQSAFLVSFSYLPREYLPVAMASAIHFSLRILADWSLLECINSLLPIRRWILQTMRAGFVIYLFWMGALFLRNADYPEFVWAIQTYAPLIIGVPIVGFFASVHYWNENHQFHIKRHSDVELLGVTFAALAAFQTWDTGLFWGFFHGIYIVKFYLVPLAFVFALVHVFRSIRSFEALKKSKSEAEKDALIGRIAMEFSHDLKSPLGSLRDWSVKALHDNDPDLAKTVLEDVAKKTTEVTNRLQELFNYARNEIQSKSEVSLASFLEEIKTDVQSELRARNVKLEINVPDVTVRLDPASFKQAMLNLVQNAIQASQENTSISINAKVFDGRLILSVQDFGSGIEEKYLTQIFDPYFTTNKPKGTGLGLSIVDRIARQHGGRVEVFSKRHFGSTFVVEIPQ